MRISYTNYSNKIFISVFVFSLLTLALSSCDLPKKKATGSEDEIYVVADTTEYELLETALAETFSKVIYTPQAEKLFKLNPKTFEKIDFVQEKKNVVIVAPLDSDSRVSKYIKSVLDSTVEAKVRNDSTFVITKYDLWAQGQLVMFLTAPTLDQLRENIMNNQEDLLYYFQNISTQRLKKNLYSNFYEQKAMEGRFLDKYGWIIYAKEGYKLAVDSPEKNFVWIRKGVNTTVERWIFVHWIENASPEFLNRDSIIAERNRMTKEFYRTTDNRNYVRVVKREAENYQTHSEVNFQDRYAIMTQGLWEMNDHSMGGPFINYTFYDEKTQRVFMLDASLFAPKYSKRKFLKEIEVILRSFKMERELSEDRKEELLEAYQQSKSAEKSQQN
jgi:hypothetical protein